MTNEQIITSLKLIKKKVVKAQDEIINNNMVSYYDFAEIGVSIENIIDSLKSV